VSAEQIADAVEMLRSARDVVVCAHVDPDGDAAGSVLGLTLALRKAGIVTKPTLADDGDAPLAYSFLPGFELYSPVSRLNVPDVFVALDTPTPARLGEALPFAECARGRVVIDHHPDSSCFLDSVCLIDPNAAATGELVWELIHALGVEVDVDIATCLYTALVTDTGRFQYTNTTADTLRRAAAMMDVGVDAHAVYREVYESRSRGALEIVGRTLSRITMANNGAVAYSWIDDQDLSDCGITISETETLIDQVRQLRGVDAVFLVKLTRGLCRVSLRSKGEADIGAAARRMGGGGHRAAAGFTWEGTLDSLLDALLPRLPRRLRGWRAAARAPPGSCAWTSPRGRRAMTSSRCCAGGSARRRSVTPARSTPWPPGSS
jgi:bifunctional oligoribonuclease and PAP phosphatase NrnA